MKSEKNTLINFIIKKNLNLKKNYIVQKKQYNSIIKYISNKKSILRKFLTNEKKYIISQIKDLTCKLRLLRSFKKSSILAAKNLNKINIIINETPEGDNINNNISFLSTNNVIDNVNTNDIIDDVNTNNVIDDVNNNDIIDNINTNDINDVNTNNVIDDVNTNNIIDNINTNDINDIEKSFHTCEEIIDSFNFDEQYEDIIIFLKKSVIKNCSYINLKNIIDYKIFENILNDNEIFFYVAYNLMKNNIVFKCFDVFNIIKLVKNNTDYNEKYTSDVMDIIYLLHILYNVKINTNGKNKHYINFIGAYHNVLFNAYKRNINLNLINTINEKIKNIFSLCDDQIINMVNKHYTGSFFYNFRLENKTLY